MYIRETIRVIDALEIGDDERARIYGGNTDEFSNWKAPNRFGW